MVDGIRSSIILVVTLLLTSDIVRQTRLDTYT